MKTILASSAFAALLALASGASAHVSLQQPLAQSASPYRAVFTVGHGCEGAATSALTVHIPAGFTAVRPQPKPGWRVSVRRDAVEWSAATSQAVLPGTEHGEFVLAGILPAATGPMWFRVVQHCGQAALDWSEVPAQGTSTSGLKAPAVLLQVVSARDFAQAALLPKVEGAWVRSAVPGQQGTAAFMKLTAPRAMQLVGVSTPVAATAEVHEMKMEGEVMTMRPMAKLDLPAGRAVELTPSGRHLMLQDLKVPLAPGASVPVTLLLRDAKGVESKLELKLPVASQAPGAASGGPTDGHKH